MFIQLQYLVNSITTQEYNECFNSISTNGYNLYDCQYQGKLSTDSCDNLQSEAQEDLTAEWTPAYITLFQTCRNHIQSWVKNNCDTDIKLIENPYKMVNYHLQVSECGGHTPDDSISSYQYAECNQDQQPKSVATIFNIKECIAYETKIYTGIEIETMISCQTEESLKTHYCIEYLNNKPHCENQAWDNLFILVKILCQEEMLIEANKSCTTLGIKGIQFELDCLLAMYIEPENHSFILQFQIQKLLLLLLLIFYIFQ